MQLWSFEHSLFYCTHLQEMERTGRSRSVPCERKCFIQQRRFRSVSPPRHPWISPVPVRTKRTWDEAFEDDDDWICDLALNQYMGSSTKIRTWDEAFDDDNDDDDDDDDKWEHEPALDAMLDPDIMVGGAITPLLDFQLNRDASRQTWNSVLDKDRFKATLVQNRDAVPSDDLGKQITAALRRLIQSLITANTTTLRPDHTLYFSMQSKRIEQAFHSTKFTVRDFNEGSERLDTYLQTLSTKLNSSQAFAPGEPFTMEIVFVHTPGAGSGLKRYKPSSAAVRGITKKSRVTIKNAVPEPSPPCHHWLMPMVIPGTAIIIISSKDIPSKNEEPRN